MDREPWREEVAELLEECASSLRAKSDRRAVVAFGTAVAYLHKLRERGVEVAVKLLAQVNELVADGPTQRFTFSPGELEEIENRSNKDD